MSNLSNLNLLDDNVSVNMKSERLLKTAQTAQANNMDRTAQNMNVVGNENVPNQQSMQMPPNPNVQMQPNLNYQKSERVARKDEDYDNDEVSHNLRSKNYGEKSESKSGDKIFGMPKGLVIFLGVAAIAVGGYFLYKRYKKGSIKGNIKSGGADVASTGDIAPNVKLT